MAKTLREERIKKIRYITIGCVIAAIILCITLFSVFGKNDNSESIGLEISENQSEVASEEANSSIGKTVEESQISEIEQNNTIQVKIDGENLGNTEDMINEAEQNIEQENVEIQQANSQVDNNSTNSEGTTDIQQQTEQTENSVENVEETPKDPVFIMPVQGEILKQYGKEKLIYSDTLKEWTTHLGIDIKADKTTIVKSSSDGCVKSIKNDPRYGLTVVIEHENGFTSVYSNLLTAEFVVVGENVKSGQTIGTVGNSATFEILDEPHLHFEILKDGNAIDPEMYVK